MADRPPPSADDTPHLPLEAAMRLGVIVVIVYLALTLVRPFIGILIWSTILTVMMYPIYAWVRRFTGDRGHLAAVLVTLVSLVVTIGPIAILCTSVVHSLQELLHVVVTGSYTLPTLPKAITRLPVVGDDLLALWALGGNNLVGFLEDHAHSLLMPGEWLLEVIAGLAGVVLTLAMALVISGFLYRPGPRLLGVANDIALRLAGPRGEHFVSLAKVTIRNVGRGVIGIAALQALLLGFVFLAGGVPHAGILALFALILSTMQVGAMYVSFPVAIWLWMERDPVDAALVTVAVVAITAFEHFAKPLMMGRGVETPTLVLFVGVLGGLAIHGLAGLFIGPVVFAVFYELVRSWLAGAPRAVSGVDADGGGGTSEGTPPDTGPANGPAA